MMSQTTRGTGVVSFATNPRPALRLICVPYAGGGIAVFSKWAESLPPEVQVCAIQLPGRDTQLRVPPFTRIKPLVEVLVEVLDPFLDAPFALFGHSMGGLIIFELARALRQKQLRPTHFFVSACRAPQRPDRESPLHRLPDDALIRALRGRYDGIPDFVLQEPELLKMYLAILRADFELYETYQHQDSERFDFPISAYGGREDGEVSREDLAAWQDQTRSAFRVQMFPGNHFFINTARPALLRALNQELTTYLVRR
jgi:surfactin synthase thioesterase subunit